MRIKKTIIISSTLMLVLSSPSNLHIAKAQEENGETRVEQSITTAEEKQEEVVESINEENPNDVERNEAEQNDSPEDTEIKAEDKVEEEESEEAVKDEQSREPEEIVTMQKSSIQTTTLKEGDRNKQVVELKKMLNRIGFGGIKVTDYFGTFTTKRVKQFQEYAGLKQSGIVDTTTLTKIEEIYNSPLQQGKHHNDLIDIKKQLNWLGYGKIIVTTYFGEFMEKRVKKFQTDHGLPVSGIIDKNTESKINAEYNRIFQEGGRHDSIRTVKEMLNAVGFGNIQITSLYGSFMTKKVKEFQNYYGLNATGKMDLNTLDELEKIYQSPLQKGKSHPKVAELKQNLSRLGFGSFVGNNHFGSLTEKHLIDFQKYYGLKVTGIADSKTLEKINDVLGSPLQIGKHHEVLIQLKKQLNWIGYGRITVTTYFGEFMEKRVKKFQTDHGLPVSGIIDENTESKISAEYNRIFQEGGRHDSIRTVKEMLNAVGFGNIQITSLYGSFMTKKVKEFQTYYGLNVTGKMDLNTLEELQKIYESPLQIGNSHPQVAELKQKLSKLGFGSFIGNNNFGSLTEKHVKDFQGYYGLKVTGIADTRTLDKIDELLNSPFQEGKRHPDTIKLKENLNRLGFGNIKVTDLYGSFTAEKVREFQEHFNLHANGIADSRTMAKINEILNSPFQEGKRHSDIVLLKQKLNALGYGNIQETTLFGSFMDKKVREFQADYGLPVSGIVDEITYKTLMTAEPREKRYVTHTDYGLTLNAAVDIQMGRLQQTDKYRNAPAYVSAKYVKVTENGEITGTKVNLRSNPDLKENSIVTSVIRGTKFEILETINGASVSGSTKWYKIRYQGMTLYVHSSLSKSTGKTAETTANLNVRAEKSGSSHKYGVISNGTTVTIIKEGSAWHEIAYTAWRNPTRADVKAAMDPVAADEFQHLDLSKLAGASYTELNKHLSGKGILHEKGQSFINGAKAHNVNEAYLVAHALLETGNGSSDLATGIEVGKNKNGELVLVTGSNRSSLTDIKTTYNMFGIGAVDSDPRRKGAIRAYKEGWFTPEAAIEGGAQFAGQDYIHNRFKQNTLYKMRWNPDMVNGSAWKQYASDIEWAQKQISRIKAIYNDIDNPVLHFDIARYN
ncbi:MAG TPA: peptidoglycan-binding protein [Cerasibacillus sp.]|uniref:peptidoglycan-binding protein n=1 Tax=Cerasibacillus sp. TaxID=2498711 RepID=UPI002F424B45